MRKTGFPIARAPFNAIHPPPCGALFPWPLGQTLAPAYDGTTAPPFGGIAPPEHLQQGRLGAGTGLGEDHRQMPSPKTVVRILPHSQRLLLGPFADDQRHYHLAVRGHGGMLPQVTRLIARMSRTTFLLFCTTLHGSANSKARGGTLWTCGAGTRSAGRPETRHRRAPVSFHTCPRRAVDRTLPPAAR